MIYVLNLTNWTKIDPNQTTWTRNNRPSQTGSGIVVNCNIILNESVGYAAQQFGLALYMSLSGSRELLAGQTGYLIDKNSIKLNCKYIYLLVCSVAFCFRS